MSMFIWSSLYIVSIMSSIIVINRYRDDLMYGRMIGWMNRWNNGRMNLLMDAIWIDILMGG